MNITINRTSRILELPKIETNDIDAHALAEKYGFRWIHPFDIDNFESISWKGIEFNRLYEKNGVVYKFNQWIGLGYPYGGIELQEIGFIPERIIAK